ncbi:MAG: spermidine/putrescine ABC transporter permease PotC [Legionellaceae bacterium]|nr:spermidine/putrescine ABC transporter permease PotC [Legionellaceae bacterium]HAF87458.1 spermidine/putrescine ABC transporter permease PotC [Legionellales bacterium]HCA89097.1 spermidine/putrescine ABC transporter permease PotC [Legionellales bacterium]|tara:strand:- start:6654 stop:7418 length:765 start_codon:yes stop_codon:yes gene_type:complete
MKKLVRLVLTLSVYGMLYLPMVILMLYSLNKAKYSLQWHGLSTHWYQELFTDYDLWHAFLNSLGLGLLTAFIATLIGLLACVQLFLHARNKHNSLYHLLMVLIIIPDLVLGIALLVFFNLIDFPLGFLSLLLAHITFCLPFVVLTIHTRIKTFNQDIYFCALDLGASRTKALTRILMPLLWPAVLSAALLSFTLSFDDVVISYFVAGPEYSVLPLTIYSLVRAGITPELNALCTLIFGMSVLLVLCAHRLSRQS